MENWSNISTEELNERTREKNKLSFGGKIIVVSVIAIAAFIFLPLILSRPRSLTKRKNYKKVIKKGLFWDTVYLIEQD